MKRHLPVWLLAIALVLSQTAVAGMLPPLTGIAIEGNELVWDAQEGATGYNIYYEYQYLTTVGETTRFRLTEPGLYNVVSFNDNGDFGVMNFGENGQIWISYDGSPTETITYTLLGDALYVTNTCTDQGPDASCVAQCPDTYTDGANLSLKNATGGACSTSSIEDVNALIQPTAYHCIAKTFSSEVTAQVVCAME